MKKIILPALLVTGSILLVLNSCKLKNNDNITPTYKNQSTGTGANPNINVVTVTGTQTVTNPATQNSSIQVSSAGWTFDGCIPGGNTMTAHNGSTTIKLIFGAPVTTGNFSFTSGTPGPGQVQMIIYGAPGQPAEVIWYSKSGSVTVTAGFSATFSNINCLQKNYLFPVVTISGNVIC
jgi:hypothetical protein